jgi:transcriptional regulator with XRE-family HTH domain
MADASSKKCSGEFGKLVRRHRTRCGITMNELARAIGLDQGLLSKIERGVRPPPQIVPHVERIALALGLAHDSREYRQLMESAYKDRFGKRTAVHRISGGIVSIELEEARPSDLVARLHLKQPAVSSRGLGDLPPELAAPDSPAGKYYAELQANESEIVHPAEPEASAARSKQQSEPLSLTQLSLIVADVSAALEIEITRCDQDGEGLICDCRLPDGGEFEMTLRPRTPAQVATETDEKQGNLG